MARRGGANSGRSHPARRQAHAVQASTGAPFAASRDRLASTSFSAARSTSVTPRRATADSSSGGGRFAPGASGGP